MNESTKATVCDHLGVSRVSDAELKEKFAIDLAATSERGGQRRFSELGIPPALEHGSLESTLRSRGADAQRAARSISAYFRTAYEAGLKPNLPNTDVPMSGPAIVTGDLVLREEIAADIVRSTV